MVYDVTPITSPKRFDCGATCLQMLLGYYGINADLDTLTEELNTRIIGCSAKDMLAVGRKYGLDMKAWDESYDSVLNQDRPSIVWWKYCHWVVVCGVDENDKVVICNPDKGRYRLSKSNFAAMYTGVCLTNGSPEDLPGPTGENIYG